MGIVLRQSIKATIVSYLGALLGYINVIFVTPYCLPPDIIGFNKIFFDTGVLFTFIAQMGLASAMIRFFPYFNAKNNDHGFFTLALIIPFFGFLFLTVIIFLFYNPIIGIFKTNSSLFANHFTYVLPLTFFMMYMAIFETYSTCLYRIVVPKFIRDIYLRIGNIMNIILFYFKLIDFQYFILLNIAIYAIGSVLNLYYLSKITKLSFNWSFKDMPKNILKEFFTYIIFVFFVGVGSNIVSKLDVFMISSSINLSKTGIFSIAFYITSIIELPSRALLQITNPIVADAFKNNDISKISIIYKKTSLNQFLVGGALLLVLWINIDNIFMFMPNGQIFQEGKYVVLLLGLAKIFDMVTGINWYIIANSKFYYYQLLFMAYLTVVTIILNLILIPKFGIIGAAITSLIALSSYNIILVMFLKFKVNIWPFTKKTLLLTIIFIILFAINYILPSTSHFIFDILYRSLIIMGILFWAVLKFKISDDFVNLINQFEWRKIKNWRLFN